jgi:hypothetical protein
MWDDREQKLIEVDEETARQNPEDSFHVGEEFTLKNVRFRVEQIRGRRLSLRPLGRRLAREG